MNARQYVYTFLIKICIEKTYSNLLLRTQLNKVDEKDKGFVTQVVYGTLQNYRFCRYQWEHLVKQMPSEEACILLDMSVYQLLCMDKVPAYAIINEAVQIARKRISDKYSGLINAVLHKVDQQKKRVIEGTPEQILAIETSHPDWLVYMWKAQYGFNVTEQICCCNMETKPQCIRVNTLKTTKEEILKDPDFSSGTFAQDAVIFQGRNIINSSYYQEGLITIQDESSQFVSEILDPQPNELILDVCSAPGTKATHIAQRMKNTGSILCGDIHEHRVKLIEEGAHRLGVTNIEARVMDAVQLEGIEDQSYDRVLCDVPCSGYGVLAQKSDIKYHMQSEDMDTLIPLQRDILAMASRKVKVDGILVYSTCTLNKKENEKQVENFLNTHSTYKLLKEKTIFPFNHHSDGFFIAKFIRTS